MISSAPVNGNKIMGNKDVAGIGIASVIHQMAIQAVTARTAWASVDNSLPGGSNSMITNESGPAIVAIILFEELIYVADINKKSEKI